MGEMKRILSLGAGVQSTTVLLMSIAGDLEPLDAALFADTGWEPETVYTHLDWLIETVKKLDGPPIHVIKPWEERYGPDLPLDDFVYRAIKTNEQLRALPPDERPKTKGLKTKSLLPIPVYTDGSRLGMLMRECTSAWKIKPLHRRMRQIARVPRRRPDPPLPMVETWMGISYDEISRMRQSAVWWAVNYYPLVDRRMTRQDCLFWMRDHGYPDPPRSACCGCPYRDNASWAHLRDRVPSAWRSAVAMDDAIRDFEVRNKNFKAMYLHRDCVPLDEVDLSTLEDHGQLSLWTNECAGICGV